MSWGIPLSYLGDSDMDAKGEELDLLISLLKSGDKESFARQLEMNSWNILIRKRQKLMDAGLTDAETIRIPALEILNLASDSIHFNSH